MANRSDLEDYMALSLDPGLQEGSKTLTKRRLSDAEIERSKRKAYQNLGGGFILDSDGNVTPVEGFQELQKSLLEEERRYQEQQALLGHQRALELLQNREAAGGLKPGSAPEQKAREADRLATEAEYLSGSTPPGAVNRGKDVAVDLAAGVTPSLGQLLGSALYSDVENQWRSRADRFDQDVSNLAAGLAVTGYELANKQKWSPRAPGISAEEAQGRWDNIRDTFSQRARATRGELGQYPQKVINGITYEQREDGWYEVE